MGLVLVSTTILLVFVVFCIIYQVRIISKMNKISQIREDFSYAMVHEMKTPLTTIFTALNFLHSGRLDNKPDKKEKYFQIAESEAEHVLKLTNKILTLSKLGNNQLEMRKERVQVEPLVDKLIDQFTAQSQKPVTFIKELQQPEVYADEEYLEEMLRNLIDNALK